MYKTILIYVIVLLIIIIIARIIANVTKPVIKDTKPQFNTFTEYMTNVYCKNKKCENNSKKIYPFPLSLMVFNKSHDSIQEYNPKDSQINIPNTLRYFNYIYDNAPKSILDNYPIAENLSFSWPPKLGSRYKLTAFPYPSSNNIIKAIYDIISNTVDSHTFPAWLIQRRNPLDFNNSIYNNNYFRSYQDIEVVHACYPPPGYEWPYCDDGGYWLYLATGSGVFWNTGKCFVSLNKLSLLYDLYNCSLKTRAEVGEYNNKYNKSEPLPPIVGLSIQDMVDKLKGKEGGQSISIAILSIVNDIINKKGQNTKFIGFKNMTPSNAGSAAWDNFISRTFLIVYLIAVLIIQLVINIRNKTPTQVSLILLSSLVILAVLFYILFFVIFEDFFRGIGWMTLDMGLKQTNMTLYQFVEECVLGTQKNPICNSLAMTQNFDIQTEIFTKALGYDSFILTSQPNKTGNWEVEICDLRKFPDSYTEDTDLMFAGGVCGGYTSGSENEMQQLSFPEDSIDLCKNKLIPKAFDMNKNNNKYILKAGPIELDISGPPYYKPTKECKCVDGVDRLCTSCNGYLSEKLCIT